MKTMVYSYKCKVLSGQENIDQQISLAHKYYNLLVQLNNERAKKFDAIRKKICPEYDSIDAQVAEASAEVERIVDAIRAANAKAKRKRATKEESAQLAEAKAKRKQLYERRKSIRDTVPTIQEFIEENRKLDIEYNGVQVDGKTFREGGIFKEARSKCGLYWGTYLKVEGAIEQAKKTSTGPLRFRRWDGNGQVAIQIQGGASWSDILSGSGRVGNLLKFRDIITRGKNRCNRIVLTMRCGSDEHGDPVYCAVQASWYRELPEDARIMGVSLVRRMMPPLRTKDGWKPDYRWEIQFTLRTNTEKVRATSGACGIDLGWRVRPDGSLRVAYLVDDAGNEEEITLPAVLVQRWSKCNDLQSIRDKNFNEIIARIAEWKSSQQNLPEWLTEATRFISQWRAKGKLARLIDQWKVNRFQGDESVLGELEAWRVQDVHLWQWQAFNLRKAFRERLQFYREFAARARKSYARIFVEDCDWRKLAKKLAPDNNGFDQSKWAMKIASVGMLRDILKQAGAVMVETENTTKRCHVCGSIEEFDHAKELVHKCGGCGSSWDQDMNAGKNLIANGDALAKSQEPLESDKGDGSSEVTDTDGRYVGRWEKRKKNRSKKGT